MITLGLIPLPFGLLELLVSVIGLFAFDIGLSVCLAGFACWTLYFAALADERLSVWPFDRMESPAQPVLPG